MPTTTEPLAYSVAVAAAKLGISRALMYRLVQAGDVKAFKVHARTLIADQELRNFIDRASGAAA